MKNYKMTPEQKAREIIEEACKKNWLYKTDIDQVCVESLIVSAIYEARQETLSEVGEMKFIGDLEKFKENLRQEGVQKILEPMVRAVHAAPASTVGNFQFSDGYVKGFNAAIEYIKEISRSKDKGSEQI